MITKQKLMMYKFEGSQVKIELMPETDTISQHIECNCCKSQTDAYYCIVVKNETKNIHEHFCEDCYKKLIS